LQAKIFLNTSYTKHFIRYGKADSTAKIYVLQRWNNNLQGEAEMLGEKPAQAPLYPPLSHMDYSGTEPEPLQCEAIN
jgi:hypothetical protein